MLGTAERLSGVLLVIPLVGTALGGGLIILSLAVFRQNLFDLNNK